ncbi:MAG: ribonuclease P protein component [Candidatus Kapabacteria bacterium]|nr:ribonuclease P protein component [Candidatus Kapabacteria bacterium]
MLKLTPIKGKKTFEKIFAEAKKFRSESLNAFIRFRSCLPNDENIIVNVFYAVSVSKKIAKKAVVRNRIKRLLRESLRYAIIQPNFCENFIFFESIILIWKRPVLSPKLIRLSDVIPDVLELFDSAISYYKVNLNDSVQKNNNINNKTI